MLDWIVLCYGAETLGSGFDLSPAEDKNGTFPMVGWREMGPWRGTPLMLPHQ